MLRQLAIKRVALIDDLTLEFTGGLGVLTGETGAGKSILLDSLGLVLGARADAGLVQAGADRATVSAVFSEDAVAIALPYLEDAGLELEPGEDRLILRRVLSAEGRSRAYINDQPISAGLLRRRQRDTARTKSLMLFPHWADECAQSWPVRRYR